MTSRPLRVTPLSLSTVAEALDVADPGGGGQVTGVALNAARIEPGDLYAALPGARVHGADFSGQAAAAGAAAVLTDVAGSERSAATGLPVLVAERPRHLRGELSALIYGHPAERLTTLGVTGTAGKTTTTHLAESAIGAAGLVPAVVGTNGTRVAGQPVPSALTTPEAPDLHALFAVMVEHDVDVCAMEVSSHALVQGRVDGLRFDVAVFMNLGHDHLDFHTDVEDYFAAKATLFSPQRTRRAVVNIDDPYGRRLAAAVDVPISTFSAGGADADWRAVEVDATAMGTRFVVVTPQGVRHRTSLRLPGAFNVSNALATVAGLAQAGLPVAALVAGVADTAGVAGRMQRIDLGQDFGAVVDYAHKPEALTAVLGALRDVTPGRLLLVLGAGGDRDRDKRPVMGRIAAERADVLVVTDDNPRGEEPGAIRTEIVAGTRRGGAAVHEVPDRIAAIELAVAMAQPGDCVVVAGKGHETGQEVAGQVLPLDDRAMLTAAIRRTLEPR
ncbi:MAG: UDP-N-acetylmuramoyl-L-alanyl-D-glutamate--2,6-diaminopimelate ligase [Nocardioidaceae bacterium]|nr:UDP-N-acetylmuramoyl-L-alanyl-D-glutamate--2,6-diaminopimelate ligase [Nocardioidaceae bacterium]